MYQQTRTSAKWRKWRSEANLGCQSSEMTDRDVRIQRTLYKISSHKQILQSRRTVTQSTTAKHCKTLILKEPNIYPWCLQRNGNVWVQLRRHWVSGTYINENLKSIWQMAKYNRIWSTEKRMGKNIWMFGSTQGVEGNGSYRNIYSYILAYLFQHLLYSLLNQWISSVKISKFSFPSLLNVWITEHKNSIYHG